MIEAPWVKDPTAYEKDYEKDEAYEKYFSRREDEAWEEYLEKMHDGEKVKGVDKQ